MKKKKILNDLNRAFNIIFRVIKYPTKSSSRYIDLTFNWNFFADLLSSSRKNIYKKKKVCTKYAAIIIIWTLYSENKNIEKLKDAYVEICFIIITPPQPKSPNYRFYNSNSFLVIDNLIIISVDFRLGLPFV